MRGEGALGVVDASCACRCSDAPYHRGPHVVALNKGRHVGPVTGWVEAVVKRPPSLTSTDALVSFSYIYLFMYNSRDIRSAKVTT